MVTNIRLNTRNCAFYKIVPITGTFIDKITTSNTLKDLKILGSFMGGGVLRGGGGVDVEGACSPSLVTFPHLGNFRFNYRAGDSTVQVYNSRLLTI